MTSFLSDYGLALLVFSSAVLGFSFYQGMKLGTEKSWKRFSEELERLRIDQKELIQRVNDSNSKVQSAVHNAQIIPKHSVILSYLEESESVHLLPSGYVMRIEVKYEHRSVAERTLRRDLRPNEVVHHIYAPAKDNNAVSNLCVMDSEQHDIFHTYLEREYRLKGHYPRIPDQKATLKRSFGGILLEETPNPQSAPDNRKMK